MNPYHAVVTITESTRGLTLLGLPTLPTAGEREQGEEKAKHSEYALVCKFQSVLQTREVGV